MKISIKNLFAAAVVCTTLCWAPTAAFAQDADWQNEQAGWGTFDGGAAPFPDNFEDPPADEQYCGDNYCCVNPIGGYSEHPGNCPRDCGSCGDGHCQTIFETDPHSPYYCPTDCQPQICNGNGVCEANRGETAALCPDDCGCNNNGQCEAGRGENGDNCAQDCLCNGNGVCEANRGENAQNCALDCGCDNDGQCEAGRGECTANCPNDCPPTCGNGICDGPTDCPEDCGTCNNNGTCDANETNTTCPNDCGCNSNGTCEAGRGETAGNCAADCGCNNNGACEAGRGETAANCANDCACNRNGVCEAGETAANCAQDCGCNRNGTCEANRGETEANCVEDCGPNTCNNQICDPGDIDVCPQDCPEQRCPIEQCPHGTVLNVITITVNGNLFVACDCCEAGVQLGCHVPSGTCGCQRNCAANPVACGGCFSPETRILMGDRTEKPVSKVKRGDIVWNPVTGQAMKVKFASFGPEVIPMYELGFGKAAIVVTEGHPMLVNNNAKEGQSFEMAELFAPASVRSTNRSEVPHGYTVKRADQLKVGDRVLGEDGKYYKLTVARTLPVKDGQNVFNIKLDTESTNPDDHMVVADGIVTGDLWLQEQLAKKAVK